MSMKILTQKEEYLAPFCEIELLETEDLIAASPDSTESPDDDGEVDF